MHVQPTHVAAALLFGGLVSVGAAAPALAAPCDAYSAACPSTPPGTIGGGAGGATEGSTGAAPGATTGGTQGTTTGGTQGTTTGGAQAPTTPTTGSTPVRGRTNTPGALPFTGGEFVLMTAGGLAAVGGGAALVAAGRRRRDAEA